MSDALERMADFDLSDEQREVRRTVREFAQKEILPHVEGYEQEERYPVELIAKLPEMGLLGPSNTGAPSATSSPTGSSAKRSPGWIGWWPR